MNIADNINRYLNEIGSRNCKLVAISKTKPASVILDAYNCGQRIFGENRIQELLEKQSILPNDIEWHMVGHLQTNKVKFIAPFIQLIHSVDSLKLIKEIEKQGEKHNRIIKCLLQVRIAEEETKFGLSEETLTDLMEVLMRSGLKYVKVAGFMGMATYTSDENVIRNEFRYIKEIMNTASKKYKNDLIELKELSIGMSGDYKIAIEEGSTLIRIGTGVFGMRY